MKRTHLLLLLSLGLLPLPGCVVAAVGAAAYGVIKYNNNEALRDYRAPLDRTWDATLNALRDKGHAVDLDSKPGQTRGEYDDDDVKVTVERIDDEYTRVRVRYGTFESDERQRRARALLNTVAKSLGEPAH